MGEGRPGEDRGPGPELAGEKGTSLHLSFFVFFFGSFIICQRPNSSSARSPLKEDSRSRCAPRSTRARAELAVLRAAQAPAELLAEEVFFTPGVGPATPRSRCPNPGVFVDSQKDTRVYAWQKQTLELEPMSRLCGLASKHYVRDGLR